MITEITNTPCEDFTQTLYTILNTFDINKGPSGNTKIVAFPHELIDNIIKQLKEDQKNSETS
ncbi:MAG: hypothetical protein GWN01_02270 [Nitrosopumilaceae archaeon]|nr:hypothetical protein [Nitrosopumilaceae archaeon]NIX60400.1 hypothetical protein [Nitrosopumilaceae archaeon]